MSIYKVLLVCVVFVALNVMLTAARPEPEKVPQAAESAAKQDDLEAGVEEKDLKGSSSYGYGFYGGYPFYGYNSYPYSYGYGYGNYGLYGHGYPYYGHYHSHFY